MKARNAGRLVQALLLAVGLSAGLLWVASAMGGGLVFRYQGF